MRVSVVVCGYNPDLYDDLREAGESIRSQTYDDVELVVVIDGTTTLYDQLRDDYADVDDVVLHCNEENLGLSRSRNKGIELASGDVVAFMDDDAVADEDWIRELVETYERRDALAVGGRLVPRWVVDRPAFLPEEFFWLIGATHRGHPTEETETRNTFGSNISFRMDVLEELGGFEPSLGLVGDRQIQGEETELAARMRAAYGRGVWFNPDAVVEHKIFERRTDPVWLTKRAFWQGYSKALMQAFLPDHTDGTDAESDFLVRLLGDSIPERIAGVFRERSMRPLKQLVALLVFTAAVGFGFVYGELHRRLG